LVKDVPFADTVNRRTVRLDREPTGNVAVYTAGLNGPKESMKIKWLLIMAVFVLCACRNDI